MEALSRPADNSDNWQPRKTRYEPCLSVSPNVILRLPSFHPAPSVSNSNEQRTFLSSSTWANVFAPRKLGEGEASAWRDRGRAKKRKKIKGKRRRKFFERYRTKGKLLLIFCKRDESLLHFSYCGIVADSILINRWGGRKLWCLSFEAKRCNGARVVGVVETREINSTLRNILSIFYRGWKRTGNERYLQCWRVSNPTSFFSPIIPPVSTRG